MTNKPSLRTVKDVEDWLFRSRNAGLWHGEESFRDMIDIPGWDHQSVWGYDEMMGTFFAQLYPNDWIFDEPALWLSGVNRPIHNPHRLATLLHYEIHATPEEIVNGLGIAAASPAVRPDQDLEANLGEVLTDAGDPFADGMAFALGWFTRQRAFAPGSCKHDLYRGDPRHADAERILASGFLCSGDTAAVSSGVDNALSWALGVLHSL